MVSQMAHARNLGEPCMAHLENLYNIPWYLLSYLILSYLNNNFNIKAVLHQKSH